MESVAFLKMDIFFAVTTAVVVFLGILAGIALFFLVKVLQDIRDITRTVRREAEGIAKDIDSVRADVREGVREVKSTVVAGAKAYGSAASGARIVRGLASLLETFREEERPEAPPRKRRRAREGEEN